MIFTTAVVGATVEDGADGLDGAGGLDDEPAQPESAVSTVAATASRR